MSVNDVSAESPHRRPLAVDPAEITGELQRVLANLAGLHLHAAQTRASVRRTAAPDLHHRLGGGVEALHRASELLACGMEALGRSAAGAEVSPTRVRLDFDWEALTTAELGVIRVIAAGRTNRHAAALLHLSPRTVSSHLRHAYLKLGINSRVELARMVLSHDLPDTSGGSALFPPAQGAS